MVIFWDNTIFIEGLGVNTNCNNIFLCVITLYLILNVAIVSAYQALDALPCENKIKYMYTCHLHVSLFSITPGLLKVTVYEQHSPISYDLATVIQHQGCS